MLSSVHSERLPHGQSFKLYAGIILHVVLLGLWSCHTVKLNSGVKPAVLKADSSKAKISWQQRKDFLFNGNQVGFSNRFAAARLNSISQQNDSTFRIDILPENTPVNPSPWYAFKIWAASKRNVYITLNYAKVKHRYHPKVSDDNKTWQDITGLKVSADEHEATFKLTLGTDSVTVAAQEVISAADSYRWMDSIVSRGMVKKEVVGFSLLSKPINMLHTTGSNGKKLIIILSRQHPPEVTGYMAMQEFVRTLTDPSAAAKQFRKNYELVLFPMINPDGVDEGNWRHSAAGVDLNRDWENFDQPETRAVKTQVLKLVKHQRAKVYFALDFHSTYYDIFYVNQIKDPASSNAPGLSEKWLSGMQRSLNGFLPNIKPSGNGGNVSKSWFSRELGAEALTYEVGDTTSRAQLKLKGRIAAEMMMRLLK